VFWLFRRFPVIQGELQQLSYITPAIILSRCRISIIGETKWKWESDRLPEIVVNQYRNKLGKRVKLGARLNVLKKGRKRSS
jgi:hypothetical protein